MKLKKINLLILTMIIFKMLCINPVLAQEPDINVYLNNNIITFDQPPIIQDDRTLVPMRAIFEALGADVYYIGEGDDHYYTEIIVVKNDTKLFLSISPISDGSIIKKVYANGFDDYYLSSSEYDTEIKIKLDVAPEIINDRMFVPVRAFSECLGVVVDWGSNSNSVLLTCDESYIDDKNKDKTFFQEYFRLKTTAGIMPIKDSTEDKRVFDQSIPKEVQDLARELFNAQSSKEVMYKIYEKFGEPSYDEGGNGFPIPVWEIYNGRIIFMAYFGAVYEDDNGTCTLTKNEAYFGNTLNCVMNVSALIYNRSSMNIGEILLKDDNTYLFRYKKSIFSDLDESQQGAFFLHDAVGTWEIRFEEDYSYDTNIAELDKGTKVAEIIFTGQNESAIVSIIKDIVNIRFISDEIKCEIGAHVFSSASTLQLW